MKLKTVKLTEKTNETKSQFFFGKTSNIDKPLAKLTKKKKKKMQVTNMRNERGNITTDPINIKKIIKEYYEPSILTN